jgi:hypothetical protein
MQPRGDVMTPLPSQAGARHPDHALTNIQSHILTNVPESLRMRTFRNLFIALRMRWLVLNNFEINGG